MMLTAEALEVALAGTASAMLAIRSGALVPAVHPAAPHPSHSSELADHYLFLGALARRSSNSGGLANIFLGEQNPHNAT